MASCSSTAHHPDRQTASHAEPGDRNDVSLPGRPPENRRETNGDVPPNAVGVPSIHPNRNACVRIAGEAALNKAYDISEGDADCQVDEVVPEQPQKDHDGNW